VAILSGLFTTLSQMCDDSIKIIYSILKIAHYFFGPSSPESNHIQVVYCGVHLMLKSISKAINLNVVQIILREPKVRRFPLQVTTIIM